ncbi:uncharacterized protein LOC143281617 [Babylonia areolata]|uniref:uncharacterized protein LOC143281617 n=1 Tax=Babylonia areolata TaxID=304850 RepID=UPI003FD01B21
MANIGGLPNLNNRRLSILQKQLNSNRKSITIVNDKLKESLERLEKSVDKRKQSDSFRSWQKTVPMKHSLVEKNALKKCLHKRRQSSTLDPELTPRNGVYDGASLDSFKPEVDQLIQEKAPSQRRLRKVEKLKAKGYQDGKLVDYHDTLSKLQNVLSRPNAQAPRAPFGLTPRKTLLRQEPHLHDHHLEDLRSPTPSDVASESDDVVSDLPTARSPSGGGVHTLQLPPIHAVRRQSHYERSLPSCRKEMSTELPHMPRRVSSFGPY